MLQELCLHIYVQLVNDGFCFTSKESRSESYCYLLICSKLVQITFSFIALMFIVLVHTPPVPVTWFDISDCVFVRLKHSYCTLRNLWKHDSQNQYYRPGPHRCPKHRIKILVCGTMQGLCRWIITCFFQQSNNPTVASLLNSIEELV